jgi:uncharacterized protein DUF4266
MRPRRFLALALLAALLAPSGCATIAPYQREHLADRIMDPAAMARERSMERQWVETREGAIGGPLGAGGGCACN